MKIGIDLRPLSLGNKYRGIGMYISRLVHQLSAIDHTNDYVLFVNDKDIIEPLGLDPKFKFTTVIAPNNYMQNIKYLRAFVVKTPKLNISKSNIDVFFQTDVSFRIQAGSIPVVAVLYDLIPLLYKDKYLKPELSGFRPGSLLEYYRRLRLRKLYFKNLEYYYKATKIVSISNASKRDLIKFDGRIKPTKVSTIYLAADSLPKQDPATKTLLKKANVAKKFLLYVGGADYRKGVNTVIPELNKLLTENDLNLLLVGNEFVHTELKETRAVLGNIKKLTNPNSVKRIGFVSDAQLNWLYHHAEAFLFPSQYEGFGLPILEAMQAGCPVIAYNNSSIPEVAGSATILAENNKEFVDGVTRVLKDAAFRRQLIAQGHEQVKKFSWQNTARQTLQVLESVGRHRS
ncbi:glycosyltransferase family 4 protein [Candidatus Saccharibacteria bacterium]|nr:glycosyltransferase family 4 protein [Candidatus Saccharibacteria bacterium]